VDIDFDITLN